MCHTGRVVSKLPVNRDGFGQSLTLRHVDLDPRFFDSLDRGELDDPLIELTVVAVSVTRPNRQRPRNPIQLFGRRCVVVLHLH